MITHALKKLPKNTFQIDVTIPWADVETEYKKAFNHLLEHFELKGYRKGKVPADLAEKHIPKDAVYQELIRAYMPIVYDEVVKKENLKPVVSPQIDLKNAKEKTDWSIEFKVAERPEVKLKNYKEAVKKAKAESLKKNPPAAEDIWVPGRDKEQPPEDVEKKKNESNQKVLNDVLDAVLSEVECEISDLIIDEELNQRLTRLVDDIQRLGLTTETYLKSKNITMDDLKKQYTQELMDMYKVEFILMAIAEQEKISVEQADLDKLFGQIPTEKDRISAQQNAYYYASILRKQKTLDFLTSL